MKSAIITSLMFLCAPLLWANETLDGDWVGGFVNEGNWASVQVHLSTANGKTAGALNLIELPVDPTKPLMATETLAKIEVRPGQIHFEADILRAPFAFD